MFFVVVGIGMNYVGCLLTPAKKIISQLLISHKCHNSNVYDNFFQAIHGMSLPRFVADATAKIVL